MFAVYGRANGGREPSSGIDGKREEKGRALMGIESVHRKRIEGGMDGLHVC